MAVPTNLRIGTEQRKKDWVDYIVKGKTIHVDTVKYQDIILISLVNSLFEQSRLFLAHNDLHLSISLQANR